MKTLLARSLAAVAMITVAAPSAGAIPRGYAPLEVFRLPVEDRAYDAWRMQGDWSRASQQAADYDHALRFASCVRTFDAAAPGRTIASPITSPGTRSDLVELATRYRGCAPKRTAVAPLLIRAAFAELVLKHANASGGSGSAIGVPNRIGNFPLAAIADCQVAARPQAVAGLLRTRPGEAAEEQAVTRLFAETPQCSSMSAGTITPTAARLAIVEAALRRR